MRGSGCRSRPRSDAESRDRRGAETQSIAKEIERSRTRTKLPLAAAGPIRSRGRRGSPGPTACGEGYLQVSSGQGAECLPVQGGHRSPAPCQRPKEATANRRVPSVLAGCGNVVTRREIFKDLDVRNQPRAGEYALQQVVTENAVVGDAAFESGLERIHIVNSLAAVGTFLEEILINVGNGSCIWVDAGWAREHALINRAIPRGGKRWRHPGLQHAISLNHTAAHGIELWSIERVRHFSDQALCGSNGKPRVRVYGDDVTDA